MRKPAEIEKEIGGLQRRREALAVEAANAQRELEGARQNLVAARANVTEVTAAQSTFTALNEAVRDIDSQLEDLREQLAQAQASDAREVWIARLIELAAVGRKNFAEYQAIQSELNVSLLNLAKRLRDGQSAVTQARREFLQTFSELVPHSHMHPHWSHSDPARQQKLKQTAAELLSELRARGADLDVVRSDEFGYPSQIDTSDLQQRLTKTEPFGPVFSTILRTADNYERRNAPPSEPSERIGVVGRPLSHGWD
ncbi:MAG: hypothetical protein WKF84_28730, partial [Pyrinomonadaceae bacterium]